LALVFTPAVCVLLNALATARQWTLRKEKTPWSPLQHQDVHLA
jgi:hypothetical protein